MRIAVLGGSFNPLHIGHAMLADSVINELGYDKVIFVPAYNPPHKTLSQNIPAEHRLKMVELFCATDKKHFIAEACEIKRQGISYTVDTLKYLTQKYQSKLEGKLAFIMGDEVASEFYKWKDPDVISSLADLIITHRYPDESYIKDNSHKNNPTGDYTGEYPLAFDPANFKYPCVYLKDPLLPVSSTDIRTRVAEKKSFKYLLPSVIYEYILKHNLYREL